MMKTGNAKNAITTLAELLPYHASHSGDATAVAMDGARISYRELEQRSNRVAHGLLNAGVTSSARVAIMDRNNPTFFEVLFGTVKAGAVLVTVNARLTAPEVEFQLRDADAQVMFVGPEFADLAESAADSLPNLRKVMVLDEQSGGDYQTWLAAQAIGIPELEVLPDATALQMYTSGTTGAPKGVEIPHQSIVNSAHVGLEIWPFLAEPGAAVLATMPLFHIAACNLCLTAMLVGARVEVMQEANDMALAKAIVEKGISLVPVPATLIHMMLNNPLVRAMDFSALQVMLIAGSGISEDLLREAQALFDCGFAMAYGATETTGGVTYLGPEDCTPTAGKRLRSAGRVLSHSEIKIVDESGNELPTGEVGEILCRTNRLMKGYWQQPEASRAALRDGWFQSGDAGYVDEEGFLFVVDRIKDMVLTGGENVYPAEVENALLAHDAVDGAAVVGVPDEKWGESLLAFIITSPGQSVTADQLQQFLREKLAGFKVPRRYEFVSEFPLNASGKVLKRTLRAPYWKGKSRQIG